MNTWEMKMKIDDVPVIHSSRFGDIKGADFVSISYDNKLVAYSNVSVTYVYDLVNKNKKMTITDASHPKFSPTKNELLLEHDSLNDHQYTSDGFYYYQFDIKDKPDTIKLFPIAIGYFNYSFTDDGNFISFAGSGVFNGLKIIKLSDKSLIYNFDMGIGQYQNPIIDHSKKYFGFYVGNLIILNIEKYLGISNQNIPSDLKISPNPVNKTLTLTATLPFSGYVKISISNSLGIEIDRIFEGTKESGSFNLIYPTDKIPSGEYFIKFEFNGNVTTEKIIILK
jgi:hypothetical protein